MKRLYISLALVPMLLYLVPTPLDLLFTLSAFFLDILSDFLAAVTGILDIDFPHVYSRVASNVESYCWYLLYWIWGDSASATARRIMLGLSAILILWILRIRALTIAKEDLLAKMRLSKEKFRLAEESSLRVDENMARAKESTARMKEGAAAAKENVARLEDQRTAELREQTDRLLRRLTNAADRNRRLRRIATGDRDRRRVADLEENIARLRAVDAHQQERTATQARFETGLQESIAATQGQIDESQEDIDRLEVTQMHRDLLLADAREALEALVAASADHSNR